MAIAFYCEDEDPKLFQGYYTAFGYSSYQQQQQQAHSQTTQLAVSVDENNSNTGNCALHDHNNNVSSDSSSSVSAVDDGRQLMHILHQVLYRYTMEGALSPAHTSCAFCNKIYYLFQLLY
ncbi:uncharacterized protein LOC129727095 [Wyeomyia smithii]|uniref:uncharacterized protein LOC129727095 n=1 Tax=Wyeomyia smithii TaxID=174621 RepID=UPI0024681D53|nr:uncharacterized protein LOC129727095 [Wyeomyia smithii]XP_055540539.1 uncharacterized protein LOC129727095 [Wyeomyia smithii]